MPNFENAFNTVCELVKDFKENEHRYLSPQYQEAEVRRDFIDKLFEALGWDVYHRTQKNPYEQEVKVEKGVSIGKAQKRADYAFYINPEYRQPKFFAEAKKPSRSLKNADDYFQTIRYGWNSNTPIAVLTDFEEFHVLDCRYKPNLKTVLDNPNHKSYRYADYTNKEIFKEIYYLFSRDDVEKNSLEKYSEAFAKIKGKGKTTFKSIIKTIDDDFLEYIDEVRETLAKAFKKNDSKLSSEELTEATQRTIDRIVFIRFLEDKLIEPEYYISEFGKKGNAWNEFISVCRKLDAKYNGIVFKKHFIDEQNFQGPEQSTFKKICDEMSYLNSPYDFNAIPIHILGSIYERFLGKVVNATAQRVKVEEKPEVRKAGGVYYTPKYIVDYIVENTVGKIIIDKTPAEISKLRFADIACGSGSFLIGVFETLLKYHTEYYQLHPEQAKKDGCINKDGLWILSIKQKQNILLNNIYGVDIDNQAVEVTQLSLALKMLEDETGGTANDMQNMFHEKILPDLSKNIICGNSLIGTDIVYEESSEAGLFARKRRITPEEERKLNPMDFDNRFFEIIVKGGFDAIIGNPPYVRLHNIDKVSLTYYFEKYRTAEKKCDLYAFFTEKILLSLLKANGILGYIISDTWLNLDSFLNLRRIIVKENTLLEIVQLDNPFDQVSVSPILFFVSKNINKEYNFCVKYYDLKSKQFSQEKYIKASNIKEPNLILDLKLDDQRALLLDIIEKAAIELKEIAILNYGIMTANNERFVTNVIKYKNSKPLLSGEDIQKYSINWCNNRFVDYSPDEMKKKNTARPGEPERFEQSEKIIFQRYSSRTIIASLDVNSYYTLGTTILARSVSSYSNKYILGVVNSKLLGWWYGSKYTSPTNYIREFESLPIRVINFQNEAEKQSHNIIVQLVDHMLESKKQLHIAKTDKDKTYYVNKCSDLDRAIDSEVYKLYGLTDEEIKIVEGKE